MTARRWVHLVGRIAGLAALTGGLGVSAATTDDAPGAATQGPVAVEFFEKRVRPILVERCLGCHGPKKQKGELRLDSRAGVLAGGSSGPAVEPGKTESSLLVSAINYGELFQMPPKSKLPNDEIEALTKWVAQGAPWGIETPKGEGAAKADSEGDFEASSEYARRAKFWSFQPIQKPTPPPVSADRAHWPRNPIDRFILAALEERGLAPAEEADRRTLIRRLTYDLIGLPPTVEEVAGFVADDVAGRLREARRPTACQPPLRRALGTALARPRPVRRDLGARVRLRHPRTPYRYRDYVVRAFNLDLPYDQFVVEQVAGDLLPNPRRHPTKGFNESILGTGFYFLGEGTHSPVDVREEGVRRIDNQIDVFSKTFLGLTVSCARCHDHKFDPISARDYYALAGFLRSSRHQQAFIDSDVHIEPIVDQLRTLKRTVRELLTQASTKLSQARSAAIETALGADDPSARGGRVGDATADGFRASRFDDWKATGDAFGDLGSAAGDFRLELGDEVGDWSRSAPDRCTAGGSRTDSRGSRGLPRSRSSGAYLHLLAAGTGGRINVVVDGFEKIRAPIYGGLTIAVAPGDAALDHPRPGDVAGHRAYIEVCDGSAVDYTGARTKRVDGQRQPLHRRGRLDQSRPAARRPARLSRPDHRPPGRRERTGDDRFAAGRPAGRNARRLSRTRSQRSPIRRFAPAIADGDGEDEHLMIRGNPKTLGEAVPRRFLAVLGGQSQASPSGGSGRLELARGLVDVRSNPLPAAGAGQPALEAALRRGDRQIGG